jgi:hypothetical protein
VTWRKRYRRLLAKLRAALRAWKNPIAEAHLPVRTSAEWSREVNFTSNQSVLRIFFVVDNEVLGNMTRNDILRVIPDEVALLARRSTREFLDASA